VQRAADLGVARDGILLDPGPDFAKTRPRPVEVLRALPRLQALGLPLLLAVSNKYFVGAITGRRPAERLAGTLGAVAWAARAGAAMLRVHDVRAARELLDVMAGAGRPRPRARGRPGRRRAQVGAGGLLTARAPIPARDGTGR
jgi:dihydropteroate synthase